MPKIFLKHPMSSSWLWPSGMPPPWLPSFAAGPHPQSALPKTRQGQGHSSGCHWIAALCHHTVAGASCKTEYRQQRTASARLCSVDSRSSRNKKVCVCSVCPKPYTLDPKP